MGSYLPVPGGGSDAPWAPEDQVQAVEGGMWQQGCSGLEELTPGTLSTAQPDPEWDRHGQQVSAWEGMAEDLTLAT